MLSGFTGRSASHLGKQQKAGLKYRFFNGGNVENLTDTGGRAIGTGKFRSHSIMATFSYHFGKGGVDWTFYFQPLEPNGDGSKFGAVHKRGISPNP